MIFCDISSFLLFSLNSPGAETDDAWIEPAESTHSSIRLSQRSTASAEKTKIRLFETESQVS